MGNTTCLIYQRFRAESIMSGKSIRYELISIVLIFILGGTVQFLLFAQVDWDNWVRMVKLFSINGMVWVCLWKGSEYSVAYLDGKIDWLEAPLKRFFVSLLFMVMVVVVGFYGVYILFLSTVFGFTLQSAIDSFKASDLISPLVITFAINSFMHGRGFLLSWREDAIKYQKLKTEQINTQFSSLKNQVNPHFLFNSLNALSSLVYDDQDKAVEFIRKLSQVYRYLLDTKDKEVSTLSEEMDFLQSYIYLQKIRFDEALLIEVDIPKDSIDDFVLPISIQMLMENAIKHNIISESKNLKIDLFVKEGYLFVKNNLQEKYHKDSTGIGLENIKARYALITDKPVLIEKTEDYFSVGVPILKSY